MAGPCLVVRPLLLASLEANGEVPLVSALQSLDGDIALRHLQRPSAAFHPSTKEYGYEEFASDFGRFA